MNETLIAFIDTLDSAYRRALQRAENASGVDALTTSQLRYIDAVHSLPDPTVTEVAEALDVSPAAATVGLKRLVSMGYATKTRSEHDRRVLHVKLTPSAERLVTAKEAALKSVGESVLAALSPAEAKELERLIAKVTNHLRSTTEAPTERPEVGSDRSAT